MSILGFELLLRLIWGFWIVLTLVSRLETSERFLRIASWITLGIALFTGYLGAHTALPQMAWAGSLGALVLGTFLYAWTRSRGTRLFGFVLYALAPAAFLFSASSPLILNFLTGALLMGSVFAAQYLGHWFLNVPGLSIFELQKLVFALFFSLTARTLEVAWTLFISVGLRGVPHIDPMGRPLGVDLSQLENLSGLSAAQSLLGLPGDSWFGLSFFGLILLTTRLLWGIVAPWILGAMIHSTVKTRSTQSATGILYALSVMILLGEGTALYLKNSLGWFL